MWTISAGLLRKRTVISPLTLLSAGHFLSLYLGCVGSCLQISLREQARLGVVALQHQSSRAFGFRLKETRSPFPRTSQQSSSCSPFSSLAVCAWHRRLEGKESFCLFLSLTRATCTGGSSMLNFCVVDTYHTCEKNLRAALSVLMSFCVREKASQKVNGVLLWLACQFQFWSRLKKDKNVTEWNKQLLSSLPRSVISYIFLNVFKQFFILHITYYLKCLYYLCYYFMSYILCIISYISYVCILYLYIYVIQYPKNICTL